MSGDNLDGGRALSEGAGELFDTFVATIARLRAPDGCPWDREQTHRSIARNMVEEAYEAVDAIERGDLDDLREELGDVLLQVVLQSQMASEAGAFGVADVINDVNNKMIRRHPHVFGDEAAFAAAALSPEQVAQIRAAVTADRVLDLWDQIKIIEKQRKAERKAAQRLSLVAGQGESAAQLPQKTPPVTPQMQRTQASHKQTPQANGTGQLDGIPQSLPALMQAQDISRKAVAAGFEWPDLASVWEQVDSELEEYRAEAAGSEAAEEEFGDLLFSLVNVARKEGIDAESALRRTCRKFRARWAIMEEYANQREKHISEHSLAELEELWAKAKERLNLGA